MHKVADAIRAAVSVPLLDVIDVTAAAIQAAGVRSVGVLGTRFTMEEPFYADRMTGHGLDVVIPTADDRRTINDVIYGELVRGVIREESRAAYQEIIGRLVEQGAGGVVLGCTEIELLISQDDCSVPAFPTTRLHAEAALDFAIG